jgi:hypothetical protein
MTDTDRQCKASKKDGSPARILPGITAFAVHLGLVDLAEHPSVHAGF